MIIEMKVYGTKEALSKAWEEKWYRGTREEQ